MKNYFILFVTCFSLFISSYSDGQNLPVNTNLSATEFSQKIKVTPKAFVLDVRTPQEFDKGHLPDSKNIDWNGNDFEKQISKIDKSIPVFVYCLSGARSAAAAKKMRTEGFKEIYELNGGIMKWRAAGFLETTESGKTNSGMSMEQFNRLFNSDKMVLIDFYAEWCAPCKEIKPFLDEISKEMQDKVVVIRINTDDNQEICRQLKIDELPTLQLYKNKTLEWTHTGLIGKADLVKQLN